MSRKAEALKKALDKAQRKEKVMTQEELRIACAEAEGWSISESSCDKHWVEDPHGMSHYVDIETKTRAFLSAIPDYSDPHAYMRLMKKIWEKEPTAFISSNPFVKTGKYYVQCFSWRAEDNRISIAIMRAFLKIMGEECRKK